MSRDGLALSDCAVFFDFDNTITSFDVLDDMVERFAIDRKWVEYEKEWKNGRIGSKECLSGQFKSVRASRSRIEKYLSGVKIDPYFVRIVELLKRNASSPVILSDSFKFFIDSILKNNGISGLKVYANRIKFSGEKLIPSFPHEHPVCKMCGNCKRKHLSKNGASARIAIYTGDGLSDLCPAGSCDIVFAKGELKRRFLRERKQFFPFNNLKDVYLFLRPFDKSSGPYPERSRRIRRLVR